MLLPPLQLFRESGFADCNIRFVAGGIDKWIRSARFHLFVFRFQAEIVAMRAQEQIDRQALQDLEGLHVIVRDLRIILVADEKSAGVHVGAADDHGIQLAPAFIDLHGPRRTALCVTWGTSFDHIHLSRGRLCTNSVSASTDALTQANGIGKDTRPKFICISFRSSLSAYLQTRNSGVALITACSRYSDKAPRTQMRRPAESV